MDKIAVIDCGCQYTHQIAESVRKANVYSEIVPHRVAYDELEDFKGLIISGGPDSVFEKDAPRCDKRIYRGEKPLLGICYGHQLIGMELGGEVGVQKKEYGEGKIKILKKSPLLRNFSEDNIIWNSHKDSVIELPEDFETLAVSNNGIISAMGHKYKDIFGLQFHPEVSNTEKGDQILKNFAVDICGAKQEWSRKNYIDTTVQKIKDQVGNGHANVFASGGIDSTVAAVLTYRALGKGRVRAIHIDNGFGRKGEAKFAKEVLGNVGIDIEVLDKSNYTINKVGRILEPEKKRLILGDAFVRGAFDEISGFEDDESAFLVQGTIYPDWIESGRGVGKKAAKIKGHHNVISVEIDKLKKKGRVVEPNILLFKYETREVGRLLGLPEEITERHPFPGPGLGVRYVGRVLKSKNHAETCKSASELLGDYDLEGIVAPVGNVGVKGSAREYASVAIIYGEKEEYDKIREASNRLGNEVNGLTRATVILDGKKYSQGEWNDISRMHITRKRLDILREADHIAMTKLREHDLYNNISQMPVILFPGPEKIPWVAIRPVVTPNFMTLRPPKIPGEMTWEYFDETVKEIMELDVGGVVLDTTNKPPGTTEWE